MQRFTVNRLGGREELMKKRLLLTTATIAAIAIGVVGMSAFEAHIINVTAEIENAMFVPIEDTGLDFGTVFPEEVFNREFEISLSDSFLGQERLDDVEYMLRQKPKCGVPVPDTDPVEYSSFVPVEDGEEGTFVCPQGSVELPLLCPYLSKHVVRDDCIVSDIPGESTCDGIDAFHGPLSNWTLANTIDTELNDRLSIADRTTTALWNIDLHTPCFEGQCAQDNVIPADYVADPANEHQLYGCDLWFEVTGFSDTNGTPTLTVIKHVINDDQTADNIASDFAIHVSGTNVSLADFPGAEDPGTTVTLDPGAYNVTEDDPGASYSTTYSTDCSGSIAAGEHKTCTVTNDDVPEATGTITIHKIVINHELGALIATDFQMQIDDGNVPQDTANDVSVGSHTVGEADSQGYIETISGDCNPDGSIDIADGQDADCTITNEYPTGTLTVHKVVENPGQLAGVHTADEFQMQIDGDDVDQDTAIPVSATSHTVTEADNMGYEVSFSGACDSNGDVTVGDGEDLTCTVTNTVPFGWITVNKVMKNDNGGNESASDFTLFVVGSNGSVGVSNGISKTFAPGSFDMTESGPDGYEALFSGDCDIDGHLVLAAGDDLSCTLTNDDIAPVIKLVKIVSGGASQPTDFQMKVDTSVVPSGGSKVVTSNSPHTITEVDPTSLGYHFVSMSGTGDRDSSCPTALGGSVTLLEGEKITCTITNAQNP